MNEQFISEAIKPVIDSCDTKSMSIGMPGLPKEFVWRKDKITITETVRTWRSTGACRHGKSGDINHDHHDGDKQPAEFLLPERRCKEKR